MASSRIEHVKIKQLVSNANQLYALSEDGKVYAEKWDGGEYKQGSSYWVEAGELHEIVLVNGKVYRKE